ncbi:hypothetical protein IAT40_002171 [Kwoniella sp. CBS 6097]
MIQGGSVEHSTINAKSIEELVKENEDLRRKVQELEQNAAEAANSHPPLKVTHVPSKEDGTGSSQENELEKMATMMNLLEVGKSRPGDPRELPHGWLYPTLPAPTFISEHEEFFRKIHWHGPLSLGPPWLAFYFSRIALALHHLRPADALAWGVSGTLIDTAIRVAKSLRIDHLTEEQFCEPARELGMPCTTHGLVASHLVADGEFQERESRRRLWWSMIYRQCIPPEWLEVPLPLNVPDQSIGTTGPLIIPPALQPTSISYLIARSRVARQVHHFFLAYRPLDKTDPKRLDLIRETDSVLRHVVDDMPFFQDNPGWHPPSEESWTSEARYLIQVFINHKRLLLHRDYFAMAETSAYYLAAANVLALDTVYHPLYDTSITPEEHAARSSDIDYILQILKKSESSEHHNLSRVTGQIESLMSLYQMLRPAPSVTATSANEQVSSDGSANAQQDFLQQQSDLGAEVLDNFLIGFERIDQPDPLWHPI